VTTPSTARKTEEKVVGDRNSPLGLILEWKMMTMMYLICQFGISVFFYFVFISGRVLSNSDYIALNKRI
jgi:hypothetical protein